ncbi:MAG TPA: EAL domain-containing response regulator [Thermoanaerobaculia bacterium]|jgi:EAL domain-containing protein (putative c-di-GMP-specific phosphodiesterase class I)|nr:EAL domain-containing response regulator [Thermoanaerobaculia bacterium]
MTNNATGECIVLADDDPDVAAGLSLLMERPGRKIILCSSVEAAEISLTRNPVTHLLCDVQFTGDFGFEGLHFLSRVREFAPQCRIVLMTGNVTDSLRATALRLGAAQVLAKPFGGDELEQALGSPSEAPEGAPPCEIVSFPSLDEILAGDELLVAFQPIVSVESSSVSLFGYEALTRARGSWMTDGPAMLFEYAERLTRLTELNIAMLKRAMHSAGILPAGCSLFVNVDPLTFVQADLPAILDAAAESSGFPLSRVVLEITERSGFSDAAIARHAFEELRNRGIRFALDDHGSAYSHLSAIDAIQPSFIKISNSFGTAFEESETRARIVRHVASLARDFGCEAILEGVESEATARAVFAVGIKFAQGYYFGRPALAVL